jgi:hypothetical protein
MSEKNEVMAAQPQIMSVMDVATRIGMVQEVMKGIMKQDTHYGVIPGCGDKPSLLQPGAQVLGVTFGIYADPVGHDIIDLPNGHREVRTHIAMKRLDTDKIVAHGFGVCSTMEKKYRFTKGESKVTDKQVPKAYWDAKKIDPKKAQELIGGAGHGTKKVDGAWYITEGSDEKVENTNPADYFNTVDKISFKRAYVHGTINATACSDIFTQDVEDMAEVIRNESQFEVSPAPYDKPKTEDTPKKPDPVEEKKQEPAPTKPEPTEKPVEKKPKPVEQPPEVKPPTSIYEGSAPLDMETAKLMVTSFLRLSPKFTADWMEELIGHPMPEWNVRHRSALMKVYKAINTKKIKIQDALDSKDLDVLHEQSIA